MSKDIIDPNGIFHKNLTTIYDEVLKEFPNVQNKNIILLDCLLYPGYEKEFRKNKIKIL